MSTEYNHSEYTHHLTVKQLEGADRSTQMEVMQAWFRQRYEDPVHNCPHDSGEGGYLYMHGGPYDAADQLHSEFGGVVPEDVINDLAHELSENCVEWSGIPEPPDVDEYFTDAIESVEDPHKNLSEAIDRLKDLLKVDVPKHLRGHMLQMIWVSAITALEAYLSEFFVRKVMGDKDRLRNFVESNGHFKEMKFALSEVFSKAEAMRDIVQQFLTSQSWHHLPRVMPMYKAAFGINFPPLFKELVSAVHVRHDLVHRGGKGKDGKPISIDEPQLATVFKNVLALAKHIEAQYPEDPF